MPYYVASIRSVRIPVRSLSEDQGAAAAWPKFSWALYWHILRWASFVPKFRERDRSLEEFQRGHQVEKPRGQFGESDPENKGIACRSVRGMASGARSNKEHHDEDRDR